MPHFQRMTHDQLWHAVTSRAREADGAFVYAGGCGDAACEATIKEETKATIRVLPDEEFRSAEVPTRCLRCDRPATTEAVWAKAY